MSDRQQVPIDLGRMGAVWVASIALFGVSAIGSTERDAVAGVTKALEGHNQFGQVSEQDCEPCQ